MRSLAVALLAASACATAGEATAPAPPAFQGVRSLALVRAVDGRARRAKDPLDGLDETLRARGFATRVIDLGAGRAPELAPVERLFSQLETRAAATRAERLARPVASAGAGAGSVVSQLGVDAIATYHRLDRRLPPERSPSAITGAPLTPSQPGAARPIGALVLVDRAGRVATFAWGDADPLDDETVPVNAAEAIDLLVRALTGAPPEG